MSAQSHEEPAHCGDSESPVAPAARGAVLAMEVEVHWGPPCLLFQAVMY